MVSLCKPDYPSLQHLLSNLSQKCWSHFHFLTLWRQIVFPNCPTDSITEMSFIHLVFTLLMPNIYSACYMETATHSIFKIPTMKIVNSIILTVQMKKLKQSLSCSPRLTHFLNFGENIHTQAVCSWRPSSLRLTACSPHC